MTLLQKIRGLKPGQLVAIFTIMNIINYLDRGIVPGSNLAQPGYIGYFVQKSLDIEQTDKYTSLLQSSFIGGYSVASLIFGHSVHLFPPFRLISIGLIIWIVAVVGSAFAPSYWLLFAARMLSGVGEASFQCVVPPYIDDYAPSSKRGLWLAVFYMAIPVGTASGFAFGGVMSSHLTWRWAFGLEALPMVPLILLMWLVPYPDRTQARSFKQKLSLNADSTATPTLEKGRSSAKTNESVVPLLQETDDPFETGRAGSVELPAVPQYGNALSTGKVAVTLSDGTHTTAEVSNLEQHHHHVHRKPTFVEELKHVLINPIYLAVVFGYAGFTGVTASVANIAPNFVYYVGLLTKDEAPIVVGAVVSVAGLVGTVLGGWLMDQIKRRRELKKKALAVSNDVQTANPSGYSGKLNQSGAGAAVSVSSASETKLEAVLQSLSPENAELIRAEVLEQDAEEREIDQKLDIAMPQCAFFAMCGSALTITSIFMVHTSKGLFMFVLWLGVTLLMMTTAGVNLGMMAAVGPGSRNFAVGMGTLGIHALGDVPMLIVSGALEDSLAPCPTTHDNTDCTSRSTPGLQKTLALTSSWLFWPIVCWALAAFLIRKRIGARTASNWYRSAAIETVLRDRGLAK